MCQSKKCINVDSYKFRDYQTLRSGDTNLANYFPKGKCMQTSCTFSV